MHWNFPSTSPVIRPGQLHSEFDTTRAGACHVIRDGDRYVMAYWGTSKNRTHRCLFAEAHVDRPTQWTPIDAAFVSALNPEPNGERGFIGPSMPFLLRVTPTRWHLYYCGWLYGGPPDPSRARLPNTTGVAISDDAGKTWHHHHPHPIIAFDRAYDASATGSVWVLHDPTLAVPFRMYYTAIGSYFDAPPGVRTGHGTSIPQIGIAYAESHDGLHWHKPIDRLLVTPRGFGVEPFEYITSKPCVLDRGAAFADKQIGARYLLWVCTFGYAYRVHRLESDDGLSWRWRPRTGPDGELGVGLPGAFDGVMRTYPAIVPHGDGLRCWFTGDSFGDTGMGFAECDHVD